MGFGVFGEVGWDLGESGVSFLQEGVGFQSFNDDGFGFFDDVLGLVVLFLFFGPFLVFQDFLRVNFGDFGF